MLKVLATYLSAASLGTEAIEMVFEFYRYRASAEFALAMKSDYRQGEVWLMLHREHPVGEEYIVADEEGASQFEKTHAVIGRSDERAVVGDRTHT